MFFFRFLLFIFNGVCKVLFLITLGVVLLSGTQHFIADAKENYIPYLVERADEVRQMDIEEFRAVALELRERFTAELQAHQL